MIQAYVTGRDRILPANVLVYTSGDYRDWQSLFRSADFEDDEESSDVNWNILRQEEENSPDQRRNRMNPVRPKRSCARLRQGLQ